jgi:hypothetical protein
MEGEASPVNRLSQEKVAEELMNFVFYGLASENRPTGAKEEDAL